MVVSIRNIFTSESQRQVKAEEHNIGLAHAIRDLITGSNHETHVDNHRKKKAVKALQKAHPGQVNELIVILKAMPDPTVSEFNQIHHGEASKKQDGHGATPASSTRCTSNNGTPNDTGKGSAEGSERSSPAGDGGDAISVPVKAPSSWWAISFGSLIASVGTAPSEKKPSVTTTTTTVTTITMTSEEVAKAAAAAAEEEEAEAAAQAKKTALSEVEPAGSGTGANAQGKDTVSKTTTSSTTVAAPAIADKSVLAATISSIKQQLALLKIPPIDMITASSFWWGFEIYVPHQCMAKLSRATNTSQIFFGFLGGALSGVPGLAALVPLSKIISAYVGLQWALIHAQDLGQGVILAATWVLPVALAPRPWDFPGAESAPVIENTPQGKVKKIKGANKSGMNDAGPSSRRSPDHSAPKPKISTIDAAAARTGPGMQTASMSSPTAADILAANHTPRVLISPHRSRPVSTSSSHVRWAILATTSTVLLGNYYAFDNPAALNQPLQTYMQMDDDTYAYFINILYTSYSLPNIVLPWLGGVQSRSVPAMVLGRVFFGAGESLAVTQSAITVKYFRGKELAMALGINLCVSRLGSVVNDLLTPYIWSKSDVPTAFWGGFVSCTLSFMTACLLVWMDRRFSSTSGEFTRLPMTTTTTHLGDTRFSSQEDLQHSPLRHHQQPRATPVAVMGRYDPPNVVNRRGGAPVDEEYIDMEVLDASVTKKIAKAKSSSRPHPTAVDKDEAEDDDDEEGSDLGSSSSEYEMLCGHRDTTQDMEFGHHGHNGDGDGDGDYEISTTRTMRRVNSDSKGSFLQQIVSIVVVALDYSQSLWVLFGITFLLVGVQVPFNSIHAGFLQMRWYHNDPQKAAQIMTVPDLISALLILPVGYFVDHYGQKSWLFMICGLVIGFSHFVLGIIPVASPVPALLALGLASAIGAIFTSAIPALVQSHQIATAYGISSSAMNLAFTIFPLVVAKLMTADPDVYTYVEVFFSSCGFCGFLLAVRLRCLDIHGDLDRKEIDHNVDT
ncbi:hypothetical protein BGZ75_005522 [Mortierella antarctica]|nr:hypothetical protein BGZ75_005522 [Mortierella antarctica]